MRIHGDLKKWNDDRGFGFIASPQHAEEFFVHISAFPRDGVRPKVGELISFEIQTDHNGKKQAIRVLRAASRNPTRRRVDKRVSKNGGSLKVLITIVATAILAYSVYITYVGRENSRFTPTIKTVLPAKSFNQTFKCDGRQHCSQMNSRAEAIFFINNCPNTKMDGDNDGRPCENDSRW